MMLDEILVVQLPSHRSRSANAVRHDKVDVEQHPRIPQDGVGTDPPAVHAYPEAELRAEGQQANRVQRSGQACQLVGIVQRQHAGKNKRQGRKRKPRSATVAPDTLLFCTLAVYRALFCFCRVCIQAATKRLARQQLGTDVVRVVSVKSFGRERRMYMRRTRQQARPDVDRGLHAFSRWITTRRTRLEGSVTFACDPPPSGLGACFPYKAND